MIRFILRTPATLQVRSTGKYHQIQIDMSHRWGEFFGSGGSWTQGSGLQRGIFLNHPTLSQRLDKPSGPGQSDSTGSPQYHLIAPGHGGPFDLLFGYYQPSTHPTYCGIFYNEDAPINYAVTTVGSQANHYHQHGNKEDIHEIIGGNNLASSNQTGEGKREGNSGIFQVYLYYFTTHFRTGSSHIINADIHRLQMSVLQVVHIHRPVLHLYISHHLKEFS